MPIRKRFNEAVPFEVSYALQCCNAGLTYGGPGASANELLEAAQGWEASANAALERGDVALAGVYQRHSNRYIHAAEKVEQHDSSKRR